MFSLPPATEKVGWKTTFCKHIFKKVKSGCWKGGDAAEEKRAMQEEDNASTIRSSEGCASISNERKVVVLFVMKSEWHRMP